MDVLTFTLQLQLRPLSIAAHATLAAGCWRVANITHIVDFFTRGKRSLGDVLISKVGMGGADSWWCTASSF